MRLGNRAQRVGIELCKDKAQDTLMRELMALKDTYHKLTTMIEQVHTYNFSSHSLTHNSIKTFLFMDFGFVFVFTFENVFYKTCYIYVVFCSV
jgi:hypothetical protein